MNLTLYHRAKSLILWRGGLLATDKYVALAGGQGGSGAPGRGVAQVNPKLLVFTLDGKASLPAASAP